MTFGIKFITMKETHIQFCENVVNGMNQTNAYLSAYPNSVYSTAKIAASKLMKKEEIQEKIKEMRMKKAFRMGWNYHDSEQSLVWVIEQCKDSGDYQTLIKAVQELNKMGGLHAPERKIEIKAEVESRTIQEVLKNVGYQRISDGTE